MASITKRVTRRINATQYWNTATDLNDSSAAIAVGDIFRIETTLGKPARNMSITTGAGAISIRINGQIMNYPARLSNEFFNADYYQNISVGVEVKDTSQSPIVIPASQTFEWKGELPIKTVEIIAKAANFTLTVS